MAGRPNMCRNQRDLAHLCSEWKHWWIVMVAGAWCVCQTWQETWRWQGIHCAFAHQLKPQAWVGIARLVFWVIQKIVISGPQESKKKASNSSKDQRIKKSFNIWSFNDHRSKVQRLISKQQPPIQLFNVILQLPCGLLLYRFTATTLATMERNAKYNKVRHLDWR